MSAPPSLIHGDREQCPAGGYPPCVGNVAGPCRTNGSTTAPPQPAQPGPSPTASSPAGACAAQDGTTLSPLPGTPAPRAGDRPSADSPAGGCVGDSVTPDSLEDGVSKDPGAEAAGGRRLSPASEVSTSRADEPPPVAPQVTMEELESTAARPVTATSPESDGAPTTASPQPAQPGPRHTASSPEGACTVQGGTTRSPLPGPPAPRAGDQPSAGSPAGGCVGDSATQDCHKDQLEDAVSEDSGPEAAGGRWLSQASAVFTPRAKEHPPAVPQ
eukprot:1208938-Rhodomonas_salina.1